MRTSSWEARDFNRRASAFAPCRQSPLSPGYCRATARAPRCTSACACPGSKLSTCITKRQHVPLSVTVFVRFLCDPHPTFLWYKISVNNSVPAHTITSSQTLPTQPRRTLHGRYRSQPRYTVAAAVVANMGRGGSRRSKGVVRKGPARRGWTGTQLSGPTGLTGGANLPHLPSRGGQRHNQIETEYN